MYAVVYKKFAALDLKRHIDLMAESIGTSKLLAGDKVRHLPDGIGGYDLGFGEADKLVDGLLKLGIMAFKVQMDELGKLNKERVFNNGYPSLEGFYVIDMYGTQHLIPWDQISMITAGEVAESRVRVEKETTTQETLFSTIVTTTVTEIEEFQYPFYLEIHNSLQFPRVRISGLKFNYSYLGDRLVPSATANFMKMVEDIMGLKADSTYVDSDFFDNENGLVSGFPRFGSPEHWDEYNNWMMQCHHHMDHDEEEVTSLVLASCQGQPGQIMVMETDSSSMKYGVRFVDNGQSGFLWAIDFTTGVRRDVDSLFVYSASQAYDGKEHSYELRWSLDGTKAGVFIDKVCYAAFDFQQRRGYCGANFPEPNPQFTQYSHEWSDEVLNFF